MKNLKRKLVYISLLTSLLMATMTACDKHNDKRETPIQNKEQEVSVPVDEGVFNQCVMSVGDQKVTYSEAMIYFKYIESKYEAYFGEEIWDYNFGDYTFGDMAKQEIMDMIVQTKIISSKANLFHVTLTEEEELQIQENAKNLLSDITEEDKNMYGLTEENVQTFFRDNKLYENVYNAVTMDVNTEIPDDEAKQITIQQIFLSTVDTDGDGKEIPMNESRKKKKLTKIKELLKEAKKTEDFYTFAEANTEDDKVEYTFGKGEMPEAIEQAAFSLKPGEFSKVIETEDGYHILYCVSDYDEDATLEKKEEIIAERQDELFQELYKKWAKNSKIDLNEKVWNKMNFSKTPATEPTKAP